MILIAFAWPIAVILFFAIVGGIYTLLEKLFAPKQEEEEDDQ
jgi:hypothetical protein